ncbi:MAG: (Fe-S)-binding protein [Chloroflexi bacterium]|nr:MAG: (Fe-S)-binding protein [Chloroflexota bacterium]
MPPQAQLFITCIADTLYPQIGEATVSILKRSGVQVGFPQGQTCCGQPAFNAGMHQQARQIAEHTIRVFEQTLGEIVIPSGSCAAMIRHHYPGLFVGDNVWYARAKAIADRTFELTEYLVDVLGIVDVGARYPGKVTYHSSCHLLRELGVDRQPRLLLANVREAEFIEMPYTDECCGFGGVFSVEQPEISAAMLDRKIINITTSQAPVVVACDAGCITHINGGLHRRGMQQRAVHIAEILASR